MKRLVVALLACFFCASAAIAADGINSAPNTSLPLGAAGSSFMYLKPERTVGIGTDSPQSMLDVRGEARIGFTGQACSGANAGAMRFNPSSAIFEGCDGAAWIALSYSGRCAPTNFLESRYNKYSGKHEYCNGSAWESLEQEGVYCDWDGAKWLSHGIDMWGAWLVGAYVTCINHKVASMTWVGG